MILLDDAQSTQAEPSSACMNRHCSAGPCTPTSPSRSATITAVDACLRSINEALTRGEYVVAAFAYELGLYIHNIDRRRDGIKHQHPLVQAWSFKSFESLSKQDVDAFIRGRVEALDSDSQVAGVSNLHFSINQEKFKSDIGAIQEYIRNGDTYQINHTFRITGETYGDPLALYARLRNRQSGRFGALIECNSNYILSQFTELFIQKQGGTLKCYTDERDRECAE